MNAKNILAINPTHQKTVDKAVKRDMIYEVANTERDRLDGEGLSLNAINRKCEDLFDKYLDVYNTLPKREQANLDKHLNT